MPTQFSGQSTSMLPKALANLKPTMKGISSGGGGMTAAPQDLPSSNIPAAVYPQGGVGGSSGPLEQPKTQDETDQLNTNAREKFDEQFKRIQGQREHREGRPDSKIGWAINLPEDPSYEDPYINQNAPDTTNVGVGAPQLEWPGPPPLEYSGTNIWDQWERDMEAWKEQQGY